MSLRLRLLISLGVIFLSGFSVLAIFLYDTRDELRRISLFVQAEEITRHFSPLDSVQDLPRHYAGGEMSYTLYDPQGQLVQYSGNLNRPRKLRPGDAYEEAGLFSLPRRIGKVAAVPITLSGGYTLMVAKHDQLERDLLGERLHTSWLRSLLLYIPVLLLSLLLMGLLIHWTLRPLRKNAALLSRIGPDTPELRLDVSSLPIEIQPFAQATNQSLERMFIAYKNEQQLLADAAHQLRTPLTVLDLRIAQAAQSDTVPWLAIQHDLQHIKRLVQQLLSLARQQHPASTQPEPLDLARLCRQCMADILPLYEQQGRALELDIQQNSQVLARPLELHEALTNLLENALLHGQGDVHLSLSRTPAGQAKLRISDAGPALTAHQAKTLFERFHKASPSSPGAGLGLAIVRNIIENAAGCVSFVSGSSRCEIDIQLPAYLNTPLPQPTQSDIT